MIKKFIPSDTAKCRLCTHPYEVPDLIGIWLNGEPLVICAPHALELVELLIDRYYPVWGQALMNADAVEAEREACAVVLDEKTVYLRKLQGAIAPYIGTAWTQSAIEVVEELALAIRARREGE